MTPEVARALGWRQMEQQYNLVAQTERVGCFQKLPERWGQMEQHYNLVTQTDSRSYQSIRSEADGAAL